MSISSIGPGPIAPVSTDYAGVGQTAQRPTNQPIDNQPAYGARQTGAQPLNTSGRGQVVNLLV